MAMSLTLSLHLLKASFNFEISSFFPAIGTPVRKKKAAAMTAMVHRLDIVSFTTLQRLFSSPRDIVSDISFNDKIWAASLLPMDVIYPLF